jgi:catechol 2,3-dioxygenase
VERGKPTLTSGHPASGRQPPYRAWFPRDAAKQASAPFLSAGGYHHIGLNTGQSKGDSPPASGNTGLHPFAVNYPTRKDLAVALKRLLDNGWSIDGAFDHGTHETIYLHHPDLNGIERAWDRDRSEWPRIDHGLTFAARPLDFDGLLAELEEPVSH